MGRKFLAIIFLILILFGFVGGVIYLSKLFTNNSSGDDLFYIEIDGKRFDNKANGYLVYKGNPLKIYVSHSDYKVELKTNSNADFDVYVDSDVVKFCDIGKFDGFVVSKKQNDIIISSGENDYLWDLLYAHYKVSDIEFDKRTAVSFSSLFTLSITSGDSVISVDFGVPVYGFELEQSEVVF